LFFLRAELYLYPDDKFAVYNITMLELTVPVTKLIRQRFSCRTYSRDAIPLGKREQLQDWMDALPAGPFGSRPRFKLVAATEADSKSLRRLGTYGFIKNPTAFILGGMKPSKFDLEDFGYLMEAIILFATSLELGTCWLGGTFTKSGFASQMELANDESMPAVTSLGEYVEQSQKRKGLASRTAGSERRLPWEMLFFDTFFGRPLVIGKAGDYAHVLEMVRLGPSASNKQPWRILRYNKLWRFYLRRTPGYYNDPIKRILGLCDLQRLDLGIAMCHFELAAQELGLKGKWILEDGVTRYPDTLSEYVVSWES